jgi:sulfur carrier protein ThiS adenylyltransferase
MTTQKKYRMREKLGNACVGIAGLGGLGSNAAVALTRAGIGHLVLVDFDSVEESNLDRQYYFRDQIGRLKIDALSETLHHINPAVDISTHELKLQKGSMQIPFENVNVVVEALDHAQTKATFIEEILLKLPKTPLVAASGVAGYGNPERIRTLHTGNLYLCYDEKAKASNEDVLMAPHVALMANWEADLVIEIILSEHL